MDLINETVDELRFGWREKEQVLQCNYCSFSIKRSEPQARLQITQHVLQHTEADLIYVASKYNHLTEKQKELLTLFKQGKKDKEIAEYLNVSASTIRHQKFTFREKAKQAKLYLATYEQVFAFSDPNEQLLELPNQSVNDDRFMITENEYHQLVKQYFSFADNKVVLLRWPKGQKKILAILERIKEELTMGKTYTEHELNDVLAPIYFDYVIVRRYLIDYGFLARKQDGTSYWRIF